MTVLSRISLLFLIAAFPLAAAESDALAISANIQARHMPYFGIIDPMFAASDSGQIIGYTRCGDSAIWTGHYLAAESYRYAVTKSPDALANVNRALTGIQLMMDVTGAGLLARCTFPSDSPYAAGIIQEEGPHGIHTGIVWDAQWTWVGDTSRDQYLGVFYGLTVAHDVVNDQGVQNMVSYLATRALGYLQDHKWIIVMPDGTPVSTFIGRQEEMLSLLKLGRRVNGGKFSGNYKTLSDTTATEALIPIGIDIADQYSSYFKFNLDVITFYGLLTSGDNWWVHLNYRGAYDILWNTIDGHQNAFFNMIDRAINGPDANRDAQTVQLLDGWLQRPPRDVYVDDTALVPVCDDASRACKPIPVPLRVTTDFLWQRSPFQLQSGGSGTIETAGIDYILPYWMARYYGVISQ